MAVSCDPWSLVLDGSDSAYWEITEAEGRGQWSQSLIKRAVEIAVFGQQSVCLPRHGDLSSNPKIHVKSQKQHRCVIPGLGGRLEDAWHLLAVLGDLQARERHCLEKEG